MMTIIVDDQKAQDFSFNCANAFGSKRIICLLFYGSNAFNRAERPNSDYDFYLLLDKYQSKDKRLLKALTKSVDFELDLTYQYLVDLETVRWENYQLGNHGLFYMLNFAQSITLLGTNVFQRKLVNLESMPIKKSIMFQIQEYFWRLDNWHLKEADPTRLRENYTKYINRIISDMLLLNGDICFSEINRHKYCDTAKLIKSAGYFSNETIRLVHAVFIKHKNSLQSLLKLQRALYEDFLRQYKK